MQYNYDLIYVYNIIQYIYILYIPMVDASRKEQNV